jgi:transposase
MQVIHERCAALDVHKKTVVTTIMITQADGSVQEQTRTSLTMTADLLALDEWLRSHRVEVIAMESTGVFWRPVFNLLEEGRQVISLTLHFSQEGVEGRQTLWYKRTIKTTSFVQRGLPCHCLLYVCTSVCSNT